MKILSLLIWTSLFGVMVQAANIVIVTEESDQKKALEVKDLFMRTPPFNLMTGLKIDIFKISPGVVPCGTSIESTSMEVSCGKVSRLLGCDKLALLKLEGQYNADRLIFIYASPEYGGSGGPQAVLTSGSPAVMALHEFLHSFGFADEYQYTACEAKTYCDDSQQTNGISWPNVTLFNDSPPYSSDLEARAKHKGQIPWFANISEKTLITKGQNLGTPVKGAIGLYRGKVCNKRKPSIKSWVPGDKTTVMESLSTTYIPSIFWDTIVTGLGSPPQVQSFDERDPAGE